MLFILFIAVFFLQDSRAGLCQTVSDDSIQQASAWLTIDKIFIIGNKKTKEKIILRELDITEGQSITKGELAEIIKQDRRKLINTSLFLDVTISQVQLNDDYIDIIIRVVERWYTIPSPFFQLADRNLNVWLTTENRDWKRVEYGLKFFQYNFRGLNERLYFYTQLGFTRQFSLKYVVPYIDAAQKNGLDFSFSYSEKNNINYITRDHRLIFTDSLLGSYQTYLGQVGWNYRPSFYNRHSVNLAYRNTWISDTIRELNPNYFGRPVNQQEYLTLTYSYTNDHRDYIGYPLKGYRLDVSLQKVGLGFFDPVNIIRATGAYRRYIDLGKGFYFAGAATAYVSAPDRQPYSFLSGLGYSGNWLRGYELDVIEGQAYIMQQNTLRKRLFATEFDLSKIIPIDQFNTIPMSIFLKAYVDQGYLRNSNPYTFSNELANRYLMGYGIGVDIISFYDFVMRLEHSWKIDGTSGFYFHLNTAF